MRNQPLILVILAMLGLSGLLVVTGGPGQKGQPPTATETAKVGGASPASGDTWEPCERAQVYGPLCRYFGVESVEEAQRRFRLADSRVVIATVPDPLDSELGFSFDQRLETLRMAAIAAGYQPDRFYLPWRTPAKERGAADGAAGLDVTATLSENELKLLSPAQGVSPPAHRVSPGAQLFRGPAASGGDDPYAQSLLLLLLVGETPTFGADPRAVAQALDIAGALMSPDRNRDDRGPVLPVVGPNFSGAVEPLRKASLGWLGKLSPYRLRFVSGTATNSAQLLRLAMCTLSDRVCWEQEYSALVPLACVNEVASFADSTERTISELFEFLDARVPRGANVALLHEADTAYGEGVADVRGRGELTLLPFPLHVSQLWTAYLQQNRSGVDPAQLDPAAKRALSLIPEGPPNPIDVPPSFFPRTGATPSSAPNPLVSISSTRTPRASASRAASSATAFRSKSRRRRRIASLGFPRGARCASATSVNRESDSSSLSSALR